MSAPGYLPAAAPIDAYGDGGFRFAEMSHRGGLMCLPDAMRAFSPTQPAEITAEALAPLLALAGSLRLVLFGAGKDIAPLPADIAALLRENGFSVDPMSTGAAARTWNVLLAEGRMVAALLLPVD